MGNFDLNDILGMGKKVLKAGAPILGTALLGPAGGAVLDMVMGESGVDSDAGNALQSLQDKLFANGAASLKKYELDHAERLAEIDRQARVTEAMVKASVAQLDFDKEQIRSEDKYVSRQRPTIMYGMMIIMFINLALIPIIAIFRPTTVQFVLPTTFYTLFGAGFLGYSYLRTKEKNGGKDPLNDVVKGLLGKG